MSIALKIGQSSSGIPLPNGLPGASTASLPPPAASPALAGATANNAARSSGKMNEMVLRITIPVVINSFEQVSFLKPMIAQLISAGFRNLLVIDQNSAYEPLLAFLIEGAKTRQFNHLKVRANVGARWFFSQDLLASMPELFIYTDPDLGWPNGIAKDMVGRFIALSEKYKVSKVGSALILPDENSERAGSGDGGKMTVRQREEQFWRNQVEPDVYKAPVNTTWHLVNKKYFTPFNFVTGLRVGGAGYECKHLPWYEEERAKAPEYERYLSVSKLSTFK